MYSERTQHVLIQESVGILDIESPCTKHVLTQYREVCPQWDGSWFQYSIGYTSSVGVGLLEEIRKTNDQVSSVLVVFSYLN